MPRSATGCGAAAGSATLAPSTSPAAPWSTSMPAPPRWWQRRSSVRAGTTAARRCCPTTCHSCCWAPPSSGSAGLASTPAARSPPTRPPASPSPTPCSRRSPPSPSGWRSTGSAAPFPSYYAILYRSRTRLDDSLDVTAAHGVGGLVGALLTGVLASAVWGGKDGLLTGDPAQLGRQAAAVGATLLYSGAASFALLKLIGVFVPLRAERRQEALGLDVPQHGEEAYTSGEGAILVLPELGAAAPTARALAAGITSSQAAAGLAAEVPAGSGA